MKVILFADIHANLSAFEAVLADIEKHYQPDAMISLGDFIDYGMRSNEIIERIQTVNIPLLANLKGNHEKALIDGGTLMFLFRKSSCDVQIHKKPSHSDIY